MSTLSRDAKFGPLVCSPGSRKPILPAQLDVTLGRFDIGRTKGSISRPMSPLRSTASNRRLIDMASFRFRHRHQESDALVEMLFASEGKIRLQLPLRGKSNCNLPLRGKSRILFFI